MSKNIIIFYLSEPNTKMDSNSGIVFIMSKKFSGFELHSNGQKYTSIQKLKYTFSIGGIVLPLTHQFRLKFSILFPLYSFRLLVRHKSHLQIDQVCLFCHCFDLFARDSKHVVGVCGGRYVLQIKNYLYFLH